MTEQIRQLIPAEGSAVSYMISHEDLIDFAREIMERTKEMAEEAAAKVEAEAAEDFFTRKEVMKLLRRCDSTLTKWARSGYLRPIRVGGKYLYKKGDVQKILGKSPIKSRLCSL